LFFAWHAPSVTVNGTLGSYTPVVRLEANMCVLESSTNQWIKAITGHSSPESLFKALDSKPVLHKSTGQILAKLHKPLESVLVDAEGHVSVNELDLSTGTTNASALFTKKVGGVVADLRQATKKAVAIRELNRVFKNTGLIDHVNEDFVEYFVESLLNPPASETESESVMMSNPFTEG